MSRKYGAFIASKPVEVPLEGHEHDFAVAPTAAQEAHLQMPHGLKPITIAFIMETPHLLRLHKVCHEREGQES